MENNKLKIIFVGMPDMALVCLENLLISKFDIAGVVPPDKKHETAPFFKQFVAQKGLNYLEFENSPNEKSYIEKLKSLNADIGVVCSYNHLLSEEFLSTTKLGYINSHPSLLPYYRGACPYFHIINNGEKYSGITLHFMDKTFDTGDIIYQEKFDVTPFDTMGTVFNRTTYMISDALIKILNTIQNKKELDLTPQDKGKILPDAPRVDGNFRIRWKTNDVFEIERLIRACNPFYNAFTSFREVSFKIIKAHLSDFKVSEEDPGRIIKADENNLIISAKKGSLAIDCFQLSTWGYFTPKDFYYMFSPKTEEYLI